jgi:hypothetical protein
VEELTQNRYDFVGNAMRPPDHGIVANFGKALGGDLSARLVRCPAWSRSNSPAART